MEVSAAPRPSRSYGGFSLLFNVFFVLALVFAGRAASAGQAVVLAFGDSLTAGYGLAAEDSFTRQLEAQLRAAGHDVAVRNAGVSGDTTAGGRARLAWTIAERPDLVLLELGANDGLRGIDPAETRCNLAAMLEELKRQQIPVLLAGMRAPPNLGRDYAQEFDGLFADLAAEYDVSYYPFFLDGVAAQPALNQADGIHPNAAGVRIIVERITPYVLRALEQSGPRKPDA